MLKKMQRIKQIDPFIILTLFVLAAISIVAISSATYTSDPSFVQKQMLWYSIGFLCMIGVLLFDYKILLQGRFLYILYGFGILLLLIVMIPGVGIKVNGAQQWIGIGSLTFQPSELMKLIFILILAKILSVKKGAPWSDLKTLGKIIAFFAIPFLIIVLQPDLGTAMILMAITASMLLVGGLNWKWFAGGIAVVAIAAGTVIILYTTHSPLLHLILQPHQIQRIQIFLDPASDPTGAGYQSTQAKIAIGSGMLKGKGFHHGTQAQGNWIPEPYNDFIFAVIGEEFGFIGASVLMCAYLFLLYRLIQIAMRASHPFGVYLTSGIVGMFVFQIYQNIGMTLGLMPITGIPLPFISYGGTSLVTQMMAIGFALNVGMRSRNELMFDTFVA
ncbi:MULTISPECIES: rod shape-determining protein RodA [Thermoactinomyces]|uniref:Peptidoglycan glycosyltransferase RodA n=1 Tax=Thermoactinomyces daqus TaxID=1329516 RepID=A0A7W2AI65_9BACL|nr:MULTISPECIES: rod shape-determining protein RodA [Thermoactinomyces]MBA4543912.1 rod shape-determining protein RodA [Thermoactinomyces daqus]MBH8597426.1 rod shape-determining protein RodA [Thermoactinomyces sp. CICC 10523]MBH8602987.1 rod shape-determining protein RodA [Thermoactinomyces sp. CICC 10522]MBH8607165.1 rod shape-determining protein RodA [Thermoactinomyces sp. CICC 10521]